MLRALYGSSSPSTNGRLAHVHVELDRHHGARAEGGAAPLVALAEWFW